MRATRPLAGLRASRSGRVRAAPGLFGFGALALTMAMAPASAEETVRSSTEGLTVAVFDLAEVPDLAPRPPPEARRPTWRTTFGSERQTEPEIKASIGDGPLAHLADIDAVLIQGVQAAARLRRMFPPRTWRLIVSRRILSPTDPVGFRTARANLPPATAIAVKARSQLRITARASTLRLEDPDADRRADPLEAAATAVRLVDHGGRTLWLASIALPASCSAEHPPCPALATLDAWRQEKLRSGEPTLIGGRMSVRAPAVAPQPDGAAACASHGIESDLPWQRLPSPGDTNSSGNGTGCITIVRLAD